MNPYRKTPDDQQHEARPSEYDDERMILWTAFSIGLIPVLFTVARGAVWGAEPTLGLLLLGLAAVGLVGRARGRRCERRGEPGEDRREGGA